MFGLSSEDREKHVAIKCSAMNLSLSLVWSTVGKGSDPVRIQNGILSPFQRTNYPGQEGKYKFL
jgi:hypothetical protein